MPHGGAVRSAGDGADSAAAAASSSPGHGHDPMAMGGSAPPLPPGIPPPLTPGEMPPNFAMPPPGMMGGMPPNFAAPPPPIEKMIPQPVAPNASLAVARVVARVVVTTEGAGSVVATKLALGAADTKASATSYWYYRPK